MTDKKDEKGLMNFDPAIAASLSEKASGVMDSEGKIKKQDGRGKRGHGGKLGRDHTGHDKATYRISSKRQQLVRDIAHEEAVHHHDIVEIAIVAFANAYRAGRVDLEPLKTPAASLKAANTLEVPDDYIFCPK